MLEITVISAQGLRYSSFSHHHLKPFITITTFPSSPSLSSSSSSSCSSIKGCTSCHVYTTRVDDEGGSNPTWGDKFLVPLDPTFFTTNYSCVYLELFTKRALLGPYLLGWVQIPGSDIFDGHFPLGLTHHLSYRLRGRDGSRGDGVVNVSCKVVGHQFPVVRPPQGSRDFGLTAADTGRTVTGIPVTAWTTNHQDKIGETNATRTLTTL